MGGEKLEIGCARRVVRDDGFDDSGGSVLKQFSPECVLVGLGADRRTAFVAGVALSDLLGGKREIVRTGFSGDLDALITGFTEEWDGFHG